MLKNRENRNSAFPVCCRLVRLQNSLVFVLEEERLKTWGPITFLSVHMDLEASVLGKCVGLKKNGWFSSRTAHCTLLTQAAAAAVQSHDHPLLVHTSAAAPSGKSTWVGKVLKLPKEMHPKESTHSLTHCLIYLRWTGLIACMDRFLSCVRC